MDADRAANRLLLAIAALFVALEVGSGYVPPYGLFHDEYFYWANAQRLGFGYVDHPPFSVWILWLTQLVLGDGRLGFGLVPALCGGAIVFLTGVMARRFGVSMAGQALAAACIATGPLLLAFCNFYSVNAFEFLFWTLASFVLIEGIRLRDERYWLILGCIAGVALLNKHTFILLLGAIGLAVLATPLRAQLRSRWLWLGVAAALLLASPNLIWNALNDWPSLVFYQSVGADKNIPTSVAGALEFQISGTNPVTALVWIPGLAFLLFSRQLRAYRPLGIVFAVVLLIVLFSGQRRGDRMLGAYPIVFAAGAACWERWAQASVWARRGRSVVLALIVTVGIALTPMALPLLPPKRVAALFEAVGQSPEFEAADAGHKIPLSLLGRLEWDRLAREVFAAIELLPKEEREHAVILASHWVDASVIDYFGRDRSLPPVVSPHSAYWLWRADAAGHDVAISLDIAPAALERYFVETQQLGLFECEHCANWRGDMVISVSRGPIRPIETLLGEWRSFGTAGAPALAD